MRREITRLLKLVRSFLPRNFIRHYIRPLLIRRKKVSYDPEKFFNSYYRSTLDIEFSDRITISPNYNPLFSRYHYNSVENLIIEYFVSRQTPTLPQVLDIGSGAGHWIDFYLNVFQAKSVVGIEISKPCVEALCLKYKGNDKIHIIKADISGSNFYLEQKFNIINAIGVMFHIVDDTLWRYALGNIANHLQDDGIVIIGGQFGFITQNVQFHNVDEFSNYKKAQNTNSKVALVNKRIRSLRFWRNCVQEVGLRIDCVKRTNQCRKILTPENNILFLSHNK